MPNYREDRPGAGASSQEQSNPHYKTHQELVAAFRAHIDHKMKWGILGDKPVPAHRQIEERLRQVLSNSPYRSEKERYFKPLHAAWQLITYDRLEPGTEDERSATAAILDAYRDNPVIQLNETQVRTLDAMAEAAGIPHQRGQNSLTIPEKYGDPNWRYASPEWLRRAATHDERVAKEVEIYKRTR
jgi:hypothetical protein